MSDKTQLLPKYATDLERSLASLEPNVTQLDVGILALSALGDPYHIREDYLSRLAWAWSVDRWDVNWTEAQKRDVVAASWTVHRYKGTLPALKAAAGALNFSIDIVEWHEEGGEPGTFTVEAEYIGTDGLTLYDYRALEATLNHTKPFTRKMAVVMAATGEAEIGIAVVGVSPTHIKGEASWPPEMDAVLGIAVVGMPRIHVRGMVL